MFFVCVCLVCVLVCICMCVSVCVYVRASARWVGLCALAGKAPTGTMFTNPGCDQSHLRSLLLSLYVYTTFQYFGSALCLSISSLSVCTMYTQISNTCSSTLCGTVCASLYHRFMFVYTTFSYFEQCTACCMSLLYLQTFNFPICVCAQTFHTLHITKINCAELVQGSWYICGDHTICYNGLRMNGRWHEVGWGVT